MADNSHHGPEARLIVVDKSASRKYALFVRLGGEGKAHTYAKRCSRQLSCAERHWRDAAEATHKRARVWQEGRFVTSARDLRHGFAARHSGDLFWRLNTVICTEVRNLVLT